jgi:hypothetical protein
MRAALLDQLDQSWPGETGSSAGGKAMPVPCPAAERPAESSTAAGPSTAVAANSAPAATATLRTLRRGGSGGCAATRACPRGTSRRSATWGPRPSRRSRAATDTAPTGPVGRGAGAETPAYRASSSATVTVPVVLGRGPCEQAGGSTGHVFREAFVQVLIGVMSFPTRHPPRTARHSSPVRRASPEQPRKIVTDRRTSEMDRSSMRTPERHADRPQ